MKITLIGCGTMGQALAQHFSQNHELFLYDHHLEKTQHLEREGHGQACQQVTEALQQSDLAILAIKPQNLKEVVDVINQADFKKTIVSLLAGTPIHKLRRFFKDQRIIRMMPNLAIIYGEGLVGLSTDELLIGEEKEQFSALFASLGKVYWLTEDKMDGFTSLASSGLAFMFAIIEAMVEAGIGMGFNSKVSQELVHQMIKGSLLLLEESTKHPGELKWQVASPGGTTIAGLNKLEEEAIRGRVINTFFAAYERAKQMSS
jgi:pyrroline-5-carboxylate reductase